MRKLLALAVLVGVLVLGDVLAKSAAEGAVEDGISSRVEGVGSVDAQIHSFPFTGRLVAFGQVSELDLRLTDVVGHGIDVAWLRLRTEGLELDRSVLTGGDVRITDVDRVAATASITEAQVREATGADVRLLDGRAQVTVAGVTADAEVTVEDGQVRLSAAGQSVTLPLPDSALLPCEVDAEVVEGALLASCTADHLPDIVLDAVGTIELDG